MELLNGTWAMNTRVCLAAVPCQELILQSAEWSFARAA